MATDFEDFYWLCGSSRAGKSTTAELLENKYGFYVYHFDDEVFGRLWHKEIDPEEFPTISSLMNKELDWEEFFSRPLTELIEEANSAWEETWSLILDDIKKIKTNKQVLIEGGGMYPEWVSQVAAKDRVYYYIPTKEFQRELFVKGMKLEPGEEPKHEGQFFHAYEDTDFIVNQRIDYHDAQAQHMKQSAQKLGVKFSMVDSYDDLTNNRNELLRYFGLEK